MSIPDRNVNFMKEMWGTTKLITDYTKEARTLQEVMYDPANKDTKIEELYEKIEDFNEFEYGLEPTYKLNKGQKLL